MEATYASNGQVEITNLLINAGADLDVKSLYGKTAYDYSNSELKKLTLLKKIKDAGFLMKIDVQPNEEVHRFINAKDQNEIGWTKLMGAVMHGERKNVEILIAAGADLNVQNSDGW